MWLDRLKQVASLSLSLSLSLSFQSWFDFNSVVNQQQETNEAIIAREREQHVLSTLHEVYLMTTHCT